MIPAVLALSLALTILPMNAFAAKADDSALATATYKVDESILANGNYNEVIYTDDGIIYSYSPEAADPTPHLDGGIQPRGLVVTASDVWRERRDGSEPVGYYDEYRAAGYVTADAYHYARAELHFSFSVGVGDQNYGYGKVSSHTNWTTWAYGTAKIFYGV